MSDNTYNGWSTYETWCANLWFDNDTDTREMAEEELQRSIDAGHDASEVIYEAVGTLADRLEELHEECMPEMGASIFSDLLRASMGRIDYREIAQSALSELAVYVAMVNLPGCLPDTDPALFMDEEDARRHVIGCIKDAEDSAESEAQAEELAAFAEEVNLMRGEFSVTHGGYVYSVSLASN